MKISLVGYGLMLAVPAGGCGSGSINPHSVAEVPASAGGIRSIFEAECVDWRSYRWAELKYKRERAACTGESDCIANVSSVEWSVRTSEAPLSLKVSYFFDETVIPSKASSSCQILVPERLGGSLETAARDLALRRSLVGPFRSGERGFSVPTLKEYWTDSQGRPRIGVFYYPADGSSLNPAEREHADNPWTLMQWQENVPY